MTAYLSLSSASIEQIVSQIFATRQISRQLQRHFMLTALAQERLTPADRSAIDRVVEALRRGLVKVVD